MSDLPYDVLLTKMGKNLTGSENSDKFFDKLELRTNEAA